MASHNDQSLKARHVSIGSKFRISTIPKSKTNIPMVLSPFLGIFRGLWRLCVGMACLRYFAFLFSALSLASFVIGCSDGPKTSVISNPVSPYGDETTITWRTICGNDPRYSGFHPGFHFPGATNNTTEVSNQNSDGPTNLYPPIHDVLPFSFDPNTKDHYLFLDMYFMLNITLLVDDGLEHYGPWKYTDLNDNGIQDINEPSYHDRTFVNIRTYTEQTLLSIEFYGQEEDEEHEGMWIWSESPLLTIPLGRLFDYRVDYWAEGDNPLLRSSGYFELNPRHWTAWRKKADANIFQQEEIPYTGIFTALNNMNTALFSVVGDPPPAHVPVYKAVLKQTAPANLPANYIPIPEQTAGFNVPFYFAVVDNFDTENGETVGYEFADDQHGALMSSEYNNSFNADYNSYMLYKLGNMSLLSDETIELLEKNTSGNSSVQLYSEFLCSDGNGGYKSFSPQVKGPTYKCKNYNLKDNVGLPSVLPFSGAFPAAFLNNNYPPLKVTVVANVFKDGNKIAKDGNSGIYPPDATNLSFTRYVDTETHIPITIYYDQYSTQKNLYNLLLTNDIRNDITDQIIEKTHIDKIKDTFGSLGITPIGAEDIGPVDVSFENSNPTNYSFDSLNFILRKFSDSSAAYGAVVDYKSNDIIQDFLEIPASANIGLSQEQYDAPTLEQLLLITGAINYYQSTLQRRQKSEDQFIYRLMSIKKINVDDAAGIATNLTRTFYRNDLEKLKTQTVYIAFVGYDDLLPTERSLDAGFVTVHEIGHMFGCSKHAVQCSFPNNASQPKCCVMISNADLKVIPEIVNGYTREYWDSYRNQFIFCPEHRKIMMSTIKSRNPK